MKKHIYKLMIVGILLLGLFGCSSGNKTYSISKSAYKITSYKVDMSAYPGVSSVNHIFEQIEMSELFNAMENKGTGIFVLSAPWCPHCKKLMPIINDLAMERDLVIYYVSGDRGGNFPIADEDIDRYKEVFEDYLLEEEGKKVVLMPHAMAIADGEVIYSKISGDDEKDIESQYRKIFDMFEK